MGAVITKQPNGKYARFSSVVDTYTHYNMTKAELKKLMTDSYGKNDYDVKDFEGFLAGRHSYRPEDFYTTVAEMSLSNEDLISARTKLREMGFHGAENWWPAVSWDDDRKEQAKWLMKELSKYMYHFGFQLSIKDNTICLKDTLFDEPDEGFGEIPFVFDNDNCNENFYGEDENM